MNVHELSGITNHEKVIYNIHNRFVTRSVQSSTSESNEINEIGAVVESRMALCETCSQKCIKVARVRVRSV